MEAYTSYKHRELNCTEAGELLGISERQFRRLRDRYDDEGVLVILDRRLGKAMVYQAKRPDVEHIDVNVIAVLAVFTRPAPFRRVYKKRKSYNQGRKRG